MTDYISRDPIIRLQPLVDQEIQINFMGGRQVQGTLKGFDHLNNIVLDKAFEHLRGKFSPKNWNFMVQFFL
jgi:U6 snRNA-associated Sm-like protein LSm7